jgi:ATP phosphoribosyltransferase
MDILGLAYAVSNLVSSGLSLLANGISLLHSFGVI